MKEFLFSLFGSAFLVSIFGILAPVGQKNGLQKHLRLLFSLFLVCAFLLPLPALLKKVSLLPSEFSLQSEEESEKNQLLFENALESASKVYVSDLLKKNLEEKYSLSEKNLRCVILWKENSDEPESVTLFLSGKAVWKDTADMERYVEGLLSCPCVCVIE